MVARLGSIKAAADALHVTASAVSRRVQTLEEALGRPMFMRDVQGLTLTEAGRYYAEQLRSVFKSLDQATSTVCGNFRRRLTVLGPISVVQPCMQYLHDIEDMLPGVDVTFRTAFVKTPADPAFTDVDVAFLWGKSEWDGWETHPITYDTYFVPLCAPGLLENGEPLSTDALAAQTWIIPTSFEEAWKIWYDALGVAMPTPRRIMKVTDILSAAEVAKKNGGIYMGSGFNHQPNFGVTAGNLALAHTFHAFAPDYAMHIGTRTGDDNPDLQQFAKWFSDNVWNCDNAQERER